MESKKKVFLATFILLVAVVLATSTTYAWLSIDTSPEVSSFDVKVTAGDNITIAVTSVDGPIPGNSDFKSYVSREEMENAGQFFGLNNLVKDEATALTTVTTSDAADFEMKYPDETLNADQAAYYAFDLYFRGNDAYNIRLNPDLTAVTSIQGKTSTPAYVWSAVAGHTFGNVTLGAKDTVIQAKAANAVRIAFGGKIFEPNADQGFGRFGNYDGIENLATLYYNYQKGPNAQLPPAPSAPNVFTAADLNGYTNTLLTLSTSIGTDLYQDKITVKIWLEGWDADAFDSIKEQVLSTMIKFEGDLNDDILTTPETLAGKIYDGNDYAVAPNSFYSTTTGVTYQYKLQDSPVSAYADGLPKNAGRYSVKATKAAFEDNGTNYPISTVYGNLVIAKRAITVAADNQSKVYGESDPEFTYQVTNLVAGDTLVGALSRASGNNAGEYAITQGTLTNANNPNYTITFEPGTLTIDKADYDMSSAQWNYTDPFPYTGEQITVEVTGLPEGVTAVYGGDFEATEVGEYTATVTFEYDTDNYNAPAALGNLVWQIKIIA
jgi:hypothetical protein